MPEYTAAVLTVSDATARGLRQDLSGPAVRQALEQRGFRVVASEVVPDEQAQIEQAILRLSRLPSWWLRPEEPALGLVMLLRRPHGRLPTAWSTESPNACEQKGPAEFQRPF